jgi:hypothetical protein
MVIDLKNLQFHEVTHNTPRKCLGIFQTHKPHTYDMQISQHSPFRQFSQKNTMRNDHIVVILVHTVKVQVLDAEVRRK